MTKIENLMNDLKLIKENYDVIFDFEDDIYVLTEVDLKDAIIGLEINDNLTHQLKLQEFISLMDWIKGNQNRYVRFEYRNYILEYKSVRIDNRCKKIVIQLKVVW